MDFDIDTLTIAEVEVIEDATGQPFDDIFSDKGPKAKMLRAIAYVAGRRENPDFTWDDAGQAQITSFLSKGDDG